MQISRLFGIVHLLVQKQCITAKQLATHFEVSVRTIYRDIEALSAAGIPVYTAQGRSGGICILEQYVLNKAVFSDDEQAKILMALQCVSATEQDVSHVLSKLSGLFRKTHTNWIEVDFLGWGQSEKDKALFSQLKDATLSKRVTAFSYSGSRGETTQRIAEPLKLAFKGQSWYLYAYCRTRLDFRFFKLSRISRLQVLDIHFERSAPAVLFHDNLKLDSTKSSVVIIRFAASAAFRVYDEFRSGIEQCIDGSLLVRKNLPLDEWLTGYLLSYGDQAEIVAPRELRETIKEIINKMRGAYKT